jgi:predicted O-methyltransferase YrrM
LGVIRGFPVKSDKDVEMTPTAIGLPAMKIPNRVERGRNAHDGYQRGWGLQFGKLGDSIVKDPLFVAAHSLTKNRTVIGGYNFFNLYLIIRFFLGKLESQDIIEFGSYRGGSALFFAACLKDLYPAAKVYALDTFEGMPETESIDWVKPGDFGDTNIDNLREFAASAKLDNLIFIKGRFQDTFPGLAANSGQFGLAHIDCDTYNAVKYCQDTVWEKMCMGGYIAFDDANVSSCIGATQAVEELIIERHLHSEQVWPHLVFRAKLQNLAATKVTASL